MDEKLELAVAAKGTRAAATLAQLAKRWGSPEIDVKKPPELVLVRSLDGLETWKRMGPLEGASTRFECIERQSEESLRRRSA